MQLSLYIKSERLDLYPDESVNLNQSVQSLRDLTKVFTDFTQSFKVPATDRNNQIFKHYYQSQIDNGFDARKKISGRIDLGGLTFKTGKIQLNSVAIKSNVPEFYDIQFFGDTIDIKDLIGDDKLTDLEPLESLDFDYTDLLVRNRLQAQGEIAFSLSSYKRRFLFNNDGNLSTPEAVNIKFDPTYTDGIDWKELKAHIKVSSIMQAIGDKYGFVFSDDFFLRPEFNQLYMSLGNGENVETPLSKNLLGEFNEDVIRQVPNSTISTLYNTRLNLRDFQGAQITDVKCKFTIEVDDIEIFNSGIFTGSRSFRFEQLNDSPGTKNIKFFLFTEKPIAADAFIDVNYFENVFARRFLLDATIRDVVTLNGVFSVRNNMPDMKVLDWFAGILKAFNLVIVPQPNGTLYVNDLNSWYRQGAIIDVTEYVDIEDIEVSRGELFKEITFGYEDSEQILAAQYQSVFGKQFGTEEINLKGLATDDTLEVKLPFENPQFERINDSILQYAFIVDDKQETYKNKPFLCYLPNLFLSSSDFIGFNTDTSYISLNQINIPSHSMTLSGGFSAQFAAEFSEYNGSLLSDNFYSRFYADYFNDLFSTKRRKYSITAQFPQTLLPKIAMNDRLIIKGERYIIDNIDTNLITGTTRLELLNDLFDTLYQGETSSTLSEKFGAFESEGGFYYAGNAPIAIAFTDSDFITINSQPPLVTFSLSPNETLEDRVGTIQIQDGLSNPLFVVLQPFTDFRKFAFDSNGITFDNNKITF